MIAIAKRLLHVMFVFILRVLSYTTLAVRFHRPPVAGKSFISSESVRS